MVRWCRGGVKRTANCTLVCGKGNLMSLHRKRVFVLHRIMSGFVSVGCQA